MNGAKPWQIALLVAALLSVIVTTVYSCRYSDDLGLSKELPMIDVFSGDRFVVKIPKSGSMNIPAQNPATKESTLLPYYQDKETGTWKLSERVAGSWVKTKNSPDLMFDPKTLVVKPSDKPIQTILGE